MRLVSTKSIKGAVPVVLVKESGAFSRLYSIIINDSDDFSRVLDGSAGATIIPTERGTLPHAFGDWEIRCNYE